MECASKDIYIYIYTQYMCVCIHTTKWMCDCMYIYIPAVVAVRNVEHVKCAATPETLPLLLQVSKPW